MRHGMNAPHPPQHHDRTPQVHPCTQLAERHLLDGVNAGFRVCDCVNSLANSLWVGGRCCRGVTGDHRTGTVAGVHLVDGHSATRPPQSTTWRTCTSGLPGSGTGSKSTVPFTGGHFIQFCSSCIWQRSRVAVAIQPRNGKTRASRAARELSF